MTAIPIELFVTLSAAGISDVTNDPAELAALARAAPAGLLVKTLRLQVEMTPPTAGTAAIVDGDAAGNVHALAAG